MTGGVSQGALTDRDAGGRTPAATAPGGSGAA
ncbi:hypothetical protein QFZ66_000654 [Streptomyces sp. B4I13]|nr:hypothetical protein [Streptomyces sp. B4I13]